MDVDDETRIFGVVDSPIKQVKTPNHINAIFEQRGLNAISGPFHVSPKGFVANWHGMKNAKIVVGFGVAVPHKNRAMKLGHTLGDRAMKPGVVNVVRRQPDGEFHGDNFDGQSFVRGLVAEGFCPSGHKASIYGAGGASTAICFALVNAGVTAISNQNRTMRNANDFVESLQCHSGFSQARSIRDFDDSATLGIDASSLGMSKSAPLPVDPSRMKPGWIVAEGVAKPEMTAFLAAAEKIGYPVQSGFHMITDQMEIIADFIEGR